MNELTFIGFITLKNKIKKETKNIINDLKKYNCNLIMISGDNEYNSLSTGFTTDIIHNNNNIFLLDKEDINNKIIIRKIFSLKNDIKENFDNEDIIPLDKHSKKTSRSNNKTLSSQNKNQKLNNNYLIRT